MIDVDGDTRFNWKQRQGILDRPSEEFARYLEIAEN